MMWEDENREAQESKTFVAQPSMLDEDELTDSPYSKILTVGREVAQTFLLALLLAFLLRFFLVDTYLIDGPSMEPALNEGERLLVNKIVYQFRPPANGDIVVFSEPGREGRNLVKRVVAVGGQTLEIQEGTLYVDGNELEEDYIIHRGQETLAPQTIAPDEVFVLGDNRINSWDSRYFGSIPQDSVQGRAAIVFWPPAQFHVVADRYGPVLIP